MSGDLKLGRILQWKSRIRQQSWSSNYYSSLVIILNAFLIQESNDDDRI